VETVGGKTQRFTGHAGCRNASTPVRASADAGVQKVDHAGFDQEPGQRVE
jgi:hypothetical protein